MTLLVPQGSSIPHPVPSLVSQPFWDGCRRGELLFQRCRQCGAITHTPASICAHCASPDMAWEASAGLGTTYSWSVVWRPQTPEFIVPYAPVIIDVDEGWQILSNLIGCEHDAAAVGMRVQVEFHPLSETISLPYFRPL
jgi:uncharacterized OB-fold protein